MVWIHSKEGMFYPKVTGERVLRLDEITVTKLWEAIVRAERRRFEGTPFPRLVAEELAHGLDIRFSPKEREGGGRFRPVVARFRGMRCPGNSGECLAALLMEALARGEGVGNLVVVGCSWRPSGTCEVMLGPKMNLDTASSKAGEPSTVLGTTGKPEARSP